MLRPATNVPLPPSHASVCLLRNCTTFISVTIAYSRINQTRRAEVLSLLTDIPISFLNGFISYHIFWYTSNHHHFSENSYLLNCVSKHYQISLYVSLSKSSETGLQLVALHQSASSQSATKRSKFLTVIYPKFSSNYYSKNLLRPCGQTKRLLASYSSVRSIWDYTIVSQFFFVYFFSRHTDNQSLHGLFLSLCKSTKYLHF